MRANEPVVDCVTHSLGANTEFMPAFFATVILLQGVQRFLLASQFAQGCSRVCWAWRRGRDGGKHERPEPGQRRLDEAGLSATINEILRQEVERRQRVAALEDFLARLEDERGPVDPNEVAEFRRLLR